MPERREKLPHVEGLKGALTWVPYTQLRGTQNFVEYEKFLKFWNAYLNDRQKPVPPAQVYRDEQKDVYVIDDGHHRILSAFYLARQLFRHHESGENMGSFIKTTPDGPIAFVRFGQ